METGMRITCIVLLLLLYIRDHWATKGLLERIESRQEEMLHKLNAAIAKATEPKE